MKNEKMQLLEIIGGARARPAPIAATGLQCAKTCPEVRFLEYACLRNGNCVKLVSYKKIRQLDIFFLRPTHNFKQLL